MLMQPSRMSSEALSENGCSPTATVLQVSGRAGRELHIHVYVTVVLEVSLKHKEA